MKKEYLVIVVALALLGVGAFFSSQSISDVGDYGLRKSEGNNVVYTDSGFSPEALTVDIGATVTFTNESDNPMWIGSNPHPVHTDYSVFDQLGDGDNYSFTFTEAGSYRYHNHLVPSYVGTIIVK